MKVPAFPHPFRPDAAHYCKECGRSRGAIAHRFFTKMQENRPNEIVRCEAHLGEHLSQTTCKWPHYIVPAGSLSAAIVELGGGYGS